MRRVVVTGLGVVSALGVGAERFWSRLAAGESGLRPMRRLDATGLRNALSGEVPEEEWRACREADLPRPAGYAARAVAEALEQAGLDPELAGYVGATNFGGQHHWQESPAAADRYRELDFHGGAPCWDGPAVTLSNACSGGTHALGHAADLVRLGLCDAAVAVGFDELGMFCLSGLSILHTISTDTIRPFDVKRSGTIFGEGAAALVVESAEHATLRDATVLAEVLGYGVNNNAYHMTAPDKGGEGMVHAIRMALGQAGLKPGVIRCSP
ncbi:MAG: hypothetical protein HYU66_08110 [Armatimonadetes bacterium]|nr:hypothetical protein [Armatimonadota bacterium]